MSKVELKALIILRELLLKAGDTSALKPHQVVAKLWPIYKSDYPDNRSVNGAVFEEILGYVLVREGCRPFYMQAKVAYVPNINYDFIFYDVEDGPISLSAKTSLRERWKQADLEALALKNVHRNALSYVVALDKVEVAARTAAIKNCLALNAFVLADSEKFDELIEFIKTRKLVKAGVVEVIRSNTFIDADSSRIRYGL